MTPTLDFQFGRQLHVFREPGPGQEARLPVLICLVCHVNIRNRVWTSVGQIGEETGFEPEVVRAALSWLVAAEAITFVPIKLRLGAEPPLPSVDVWEITGTMQVGLTQITFLYGWRDHDDPYA